MGDTNQKLPLTRQNVFNYILSEASDFYTSRISVANGFNVDDVAGQILGDKACRNEFISALVNKIGMSKVKSKMIEDKLALLDGESLPFGAGIEELFVNPAISTKYDMESQDMLKNVMPDVKALYYGVNRQSKYRVTVSVQMLRRGFKSDSAFSRLISEIVGSLYSGDKLDNMLFKKSLISHAVTNGNVVIRKHTYEIEDMTKEDATNLVKELITDALNMTDASTVYNMYSKVASEGEKTAGTDHVITFTDIKDQYLLVRNDVYTNMNVDVLAMAFNVQKAELLGRIIPVNNFNDAKVMAVLCDKAWWVISDLIYETDDFSNGENLTRKTWLHHHQIMRYSMFANCVAYTYGDTAVESTGYSLPKVDDVLVKRVGELEDLGLE